MAGGLWDISLVARGLDSSLLTSFRRWRNSDVVMAAADDKLKAARYQICQQSVGFGSIQRPSCVPDWAGPIYTGN